MKEETSQYESNFTTRYQVAWKEGGDCRGQRRLRKKRPSEENQGVEATGKNLNDLKLQKANDAKIAQEQLEAAQALKAEIEAEDKKVILKMKTGEGGRTFGSISSKEIAAAVKEQLGYDIDKKKIQMKEPVKSLGMHLIQVRLHTKVTAELKVSVQEA